MDNYRALYPKIQSVVITPYASNTVAFRSYDASITITPKAGNGPAKVSQFFKGEQAKTVTANAHIHKLIKEYNLV